MEWKYKNITNMSEKEQKDFAEHPHEWMQKQIKEALHYDSIIAKCYMAFVSLYNVDDPFEDIKFLTFLAFQALLSNSINFKQLIEAMKLQNPRPIIISKENIILRKIR